MSFVLTEEQELLRATARKFLADRSDSEAVRRSMMTDEGHIPSEWAETAAMGWQAMAIPEAYGGAGYTWREVAVLAEEMGRALWCAPYLSSAVLGTAAVLAAATEEQKAAVLPAVAAGEVRLALAHLGPSGEPTAEAIHVTAVRDGDAWNLDGESSFVLDGATADRLVVAARTGDGGVGLFLVDADAAGLTRTPLEVMDLTRKQARLTFDACPGEPLGDPHGAWPHLDRAVTVAAVILANEQVGGAQRVLEMGTDYARTRKQFGRAIGSFQAVKHALADMLTDVEAAKSAAYHAAQALADDDPDEIAVAAPMAAAYASEVYEAAAKDNIQVHGGIGFTWEHDAHLYFKRAKSSKLMLGSPGLWRGRLADHLGF